MARKHTTSGFYEIVFPGADNVRVLCVTCSEKACIRMPSVPQWRSDNGRRCELCGATRKA